jgi:hypothetical protein
MIAEKRKSEIKMAAPKKAAASGGNPFGALVHLLYT